MPCGSAVSGALEKRGERAVAFAAAERERERREERTSALSVYLGSGEISTCEAAGGGCSARRFLPIGGDRAKRYSPSIEECAGASSSALKNRRRAAELLDDLASALEAV